MTAHRPATVTWPALLLLLLAACMPASPVAPASTATLVAPSTRPATLTPTLAPTPAPTPTPLPRPQLSLPDDSLFSPTEQAALQSLISAAPAQWGITADMDLQPDRGNGIIYLVAINRADDQLAGRIIVLDTITATAPLAIADLADARALAQSLGAEVNIIVVSLVPPHDGQVVGVDGDGNVVVVFDVASKQWRPATPPTPEPTATPETRIKEENGVYTAMTEKGEALIAPAVPGTKQGVEAVNGIDRVVYRAEANNPYGLEAGTLAGYFYPDTYTVVDDLEKNAAAVGAVALRGEVVAYQMAQIGAPQKVAIFPLPIDPTNADPKDDPRVIVQETTTTTLKKKDIFMSVPKGVQIVNPLPPSSETNKNLSASEQAWGTAVSFGEPGTVLGKYRLLVIYDGGKTSINPIQAEIGFPILSVKSERFTNGNITKLTQERRLVKPVNDINLEIASGSSTFSSNSSDITDVGLNNMLMQGQSFTLVIATPQ